MAKIENYNNDVSITGTDRLFGSSYEGTVNGNAVYKTKNYLVSDVIDKISSEVVLTNDKYSVARFKFTNEEIYALGDANSGILELDSVSGEYKYWTLIPAIPGKGIYVNEVIIMGGKQTVPFNENYFMVLSRRRIGGSEWWVYPLQPFNMTPEYICNVSDPFGNPGSAEQFLIDSPIFLEIRNTNVMTEGNGTLGIWIEYKYFDLDVDFQ